MSKDTSGEPEGSRLRATLDLTDIESHCPRLVAGLTFETPVGEESPAGSLLTEPLALVREAVRQFKDNRDARPDRKRMEAGKRLVNEHRPTGPSRTPRPSKHGRGRLF